MAKTNDVIVEVSTASTYELDAKKKNAIYIKNISKNDIDLNSFVITDDKLTFTTGSGTKTYTVSNFTGVKYIKTDEAEETFLTDLTTSMIRYTGDYVIKKDKVTGSIYNDNMNYASYRIDNDPSITDSNLSGLNISGGTGKDTITGTIYKDKITGNAGDDVISGGKGDDSITGGAGNNVINYSKGDGNDVIYLTKGENFTLNFTDLDLNSLDFQYANNNKDLEISYQNGVKRETITLKDFVRKDVTNNKTQKTPDSSSVYLTTTDYNGNNRIDLRDAIVYIDEKDVYLYKIIANKQNVKGTWLNDHIDAKASEELLNKKGGHINMKLNGGNGNDLIESSNYADDLTGGKGENIIEYTSLNQINGDRIYLTKGETLWIDLNALGLNKENLSYKVEGKNLNVTVTKDDNSATFTLMNFAAKDITGANTGVYIYTDHALDLRSDIFMNTIEVSKNFTGSWLSERIEGLLTSPTNAKNNKGLTLSGGAGNDEIYGTNYNDTLKGGADKDTIYGGTGNDNLNGGDGNDNLNGGEGDDTIKGGAGNDIIAGGKGNDSLYGEKGDNVFVFNTGDGVDTIYSGTGADTIRFAGNDATIDLLTFDRPTNSKGALTNDLVIHYGIDRNSSITIKNYYKTNKKGELTTSIKYIQINDGAKQTIPDVINYINNLGEGVIVNGSGNNFNITSATKYVIGTDENDIVNLASSNQSNIYVLAGEGNNTITGKTSSNTNYYIYSGSGNDAITTGNGVDIINAGDGANIITTGSGKKTITVGNSTAEDNQGSTITLSGNNSRSEITTGTGDDEITLNGSSSSYIKIESEGGNNTINYRKDDLSNVYQTNSTITAGAGDDILNMGTLCDNEIDLGDGDNTITIKGRRNTITTGSGDDKITINHTNANTNTIDAGDGNNNIYVTGGGNAVTTGSGNDTIEAAGSGEDTINGGDGANIITAGSGKKTITVGNSTTEDNKGSIITLSGNNSESEITTGTGNDTITLNGSSSSIITIESEGGNNIIDYLKDYTNNPYSTGSNITTGTGDDTLNMGTLCNNEIDLGDGNNAITLKGHHNTIATGSGDDEITINHAYANTNTIDAGDGNNTIFASGSYNTVTAGSGNDKITLSSHSNEINAGGGNNTISVKSGNDTITAGAGNDTLTMTGSTGYDTINLGNGNNTVETEYFYSSELTTGSGNDTITLGHTSNATINAGSGSNIITTGGGHVNITASGDAKQTITIGDSSHSIYDNSTVTTGGGNDEINIWSYGYDVEVTSSGGNNTIKYGLGMTGTGGTSRTTITVGNGDDNIIIGSFDLFHPIRLNQFL